MNLPVVILRRMIQLPTGVHKILLSGNDRTVTVDIERPEIITSDFCDVCQEAADSLLRQWPDYESDGSHRLNSQPVR